MSAVDFRGTWKLNPARSNIPPVTKSQTLTIDTDGFNVTMREVLVNGKDETLVISLTGGFDGKDYPVEGTPFADTVAFRLLTPCVIEGVAKKDGRVCVKETAVLADSGDSIGVTYRSIDREGVVVEYFGFFERISDHG